MRTPEEIKMGLECCSHVDRCHICPYNDDCHIDDCDTCPMHMECYEYIEQLEAQVPRWISVEEGLPEDGKAVIVVFADQFRTMAWRNHGEWYTRPHITETGITHWMPLPEPPEED